MSSKNDDDDDDDGVDDVDMLSGFNNGFICFLLFIFRCFGLLISPGKNIKNSDMHLIDMVCYHHL